MNSAADRGVGVSGSLSASSGIAERERLDIQEHLASLTAMAGAATSEFKNGDEYLVTHGDQDRALVAWEQAVALNMQTISIGKRHASFQVAFNEDGGISENSSGTRAPHQAELHSLVRLYHRIYGQQGDLLRRIGRLEEAHHNYGLGAKIETSGSAVYVRSAHCRFNHFTTAIEVGGKRATASPVPPHDFSKELMALRSRLQQRIDDPQDLDPQANVQLALTIVLLGDAIEARRVVPEYFAQYTRLVSQQEVFAQLHSMRSMLVKLEELEDPVARLLEWAIELLVANIQESGQDFIVLLRRHAFFAPIGDDDLLKLIVVSPRISVPEGSVLFEQGEKGDFAYLIVNGNVSVDVSTELGSTTVAELTRGDMVGEIAAFSETRRTATVKSTTTSVLLRIERAAVQSVFEKSPAAAMAVVGELGKQRQDLNEIVSILSRAAVALANEEFKPRMLDVLRDRADTFGHFATVFDTMAQQIEQKRHFTDELRTVAQIQKTSLPERIEVDRSSGTVDVAGTIDSNNFFGSDFYDFFMVDDRHLRFVVARASDSGVPAVLFMAILRTVLRFSARDLVDPGAVLNRINALLVANNSQGRSASIFWGQLDVETGKLEFSSAGQIWTGILPTSGPVEQLNCKGLPIGLFKEALYSSGVVELEPGARLIVSACSADQANVIEKTATDSNVLRSVEMNSKDERAKDLLDALLVAADRRSGNTTSKDRMVNLAVCFGAAD